MDSMDIINLIFNSIENQAVLNAEENESLVPAYLTHKNESKIDLFS